MSPAAAETNAIVARNLAQVQENIAQAAASRSVHLVCVTKYAQDAWIQALLDCGATDLAENLLPRAAERFDELQAAGRRFTRHLIGAPQSRKVKLIAAHFDWLQALERFSVAQELNAQLGIIGQTMDVLLQVNISGEPQKHGVLPEQTLELAAQVHAECPALRLRGLMAVPPWPDAYASMAEFEHETRGYFGQMRQLFDKMRAALPSHEGADVLSLGMSLDYVWAVEEGASMVRVGGALFEGLEG